MKLSVDSLVGAAADQQLLLFEILFQTIFCSEVTVCVFFLGHFLLWNGHLHITGVLDLA